MMRHFSAAAVAAALVLAASPASAQIVNMVATLTGGEETPQVNTGAVGTATVQVDVQGQEMSVTLNIFNLPTGTTAGHIHVAPLGQAGPTVFDFPIPAGRTDDLSLVFRIGPTQFRARPAIGINTIADAIQSIVLGNAYINIHTSANPGGEIRGQLTVRR